MGRRLEKIPQSRFAVPTFGSSIGTARRSAGMPHRNGTTSRNRLIGARRRRSQAAGNAILLAPPERLAQAGCSYYELYDARTYLSGPVMPMLRHLRRQKVKFSGTGDLPIASTRWMHV